MNPRRRLISAISLFAIFLIAGCAQPTRVTGENVREIWRGRLALRIESDQPQSFAAGFELSGNARIGELVLSSPWGSTLASLNWTAQTATLRANGIRRDYDSLDDLLTELTGTAIPIASLFAWLNGDNAAAAGWQADLSQLSQGRLLARRTQPAPAAELRLLLEPQAARDNPPS